MQLLWNALAGLTADGKGVRIDPPGCRRYVQRRNDWDKDRALELFGQDWAQLPVDATVTLNLVATSLDIRM